VVIDLVQFVSAHMTLEFPDRNPESANKRVCKRVERDRRQTDLSPISLRLFYQYGNCYKAAAIDAGWTRWSLNPRPKPKI
jgi:hypothetical protein